MASPDDKKISQLPENPAVLDNDEFSTITPRTDGTIGYENVKTPGWKLKDYVNTDPHIKGQATYASGDRAHPSIAHESDTDTGVFFPSDDTLAIGTAGVETITLDPHNNAIIGPNEIVPNDSRDGFLYLPTMDGSPTALPRQIDFKTPIIVDRVNNVAFIFTSGAWRPLAGTGTGGGGGGAIIPTPVTRLDALDDVKAKGANRPANGDALVYDTASNAWKPARSGMEVTIRPNRLQAYPNPASLPAGHLILTIENGVKEIAVVSAAKKIEILYSDSELATKIAASSLFQGVKPDMAALATLPTPAPTNKGFYWTWTGPASTPVVPGDFPNGGGFTATLQVGDWIQSDGTGFVHVPSDLMSKLRWKAVGSFQTWTDTNFEVDTLVVHNGRFYRATAAITTGDPAPDVGGSWIDITPNYNIGDLLDVDLQANVPQIGDTLVFDGVSWVSERATIDRLEDIVDCSELGSATEGQAIIWSATNNRWEPKTLGQPIVYYGAGAYDPANVVAPNYGMPTGVIPDPTEWIPAAGDLYIDTATGVITLLTGGGTTPASPTGNRADPVTGGTTTTVDLTQFKLGELADVDLTTVAQANGDALVWDANSNSWVNAQLATREYVNLQVETLSIGLSHNIPVEGFRSTPPVNPPAGEYFIVGQNATGDFAGYENQIAFFAKDSSGSFGWHFTAPTAGETRLVEDQQGLFTWNATSSTWVKIANSTVNAATASLFTVGDIKQSILTEPQFIAELGVAEGRKWVLADGRDITGTRYATITGNNKVPDLRGAYLRMAGQNATNAAWNGGALNSYQEDSTKRPNNPFVTDSSGAHSHLLGMAVYGGDANSPLINGYPRGAAGSRRTVGNVGQDFPASMPGTDTATAHTHTISGGDAETKPKTYTTNFFIKVD